MVTHEEYHVLRLYRLFKQGKFLYAGGLMDQPNAYVEMMELIDYYLKEPAHGTGEEGS